jgi:hypothetical protein
LIPSQEGRNSQSEFAKSIGLNILRFTDGEVLGRGDFVMNKIKEYVQGYESLFVCSYDGHTH